MTTTTHSQLIAQKHHLGSLLNLATGHAACEQATEAHYGTQGMKTSSLDMIHQRDDMIDIALKLYHQGKP